MREKQKLYLLTDYYPYGQSEPFVAEETAQMSRYFDVTVMPRYVSDGFVRQLPEGVQLLAVPRSKGFFSMVRAGIGFLFSSWGREEIAAVLASGERRVSRLKKSLSSWISADLTWKALKASGAVDKPEGAVYYSFWYTPTALALSFHRRELAGAKVVVRTNGYDLYNHRAAGGRQPFKPAADRGLDMVISSCQYGQEYYKKTFGFTPGVKYVCSLLGTGNEPQMCRKGEKRFRLVSCSAVSPVKRVERIVEALELIAEEVPIEWIHMGGGESFAQLEQTARQRLSHKKNVSWRLLGGLPHEQVLQQYREEAWDCFITTSQSEGGCPVSIQEALAFGMPVIATAVGGITEMLTESENVLLSPDAEAREIAEAIERIYHLSSEARETLCSFNRRRWEERYRADINGRILAEMIQNC